MKKVLGKDLLFSIVIFALVISTAQAGYKVQNGRILNDGNAPIQLRGSAT